MSKFIIALALVVFGLMPCAARAQMSLSMIGTGPRGYDFMIGSWSCKNSVPSRLGGPLTSNLTISRANNGSLFIRSRAANYDSASYTGAPVATISNSVSFPIGVSFNASGNLFVANGNNNTVTAKHSFTARRTRGRR